MGVHQFQSMHSDDIDPISITPDIWKSDQPGGPARFFQALAIAFRMLAYRVTCFLFCHLGFLKLVFTVLRPLRPIARFGKLMVLTKAEDIRECLSRFNDFALGEVIEPGMPWGSFIMTVDWSEQHRVERDLLQSAVDPVADAQTITRILAKKSQERLDRADHRMDAVADFAEPVVLGLISDYFGISPVKNDPRRMAQATRDLAGIIMVNPPVGSKPWINSRDSIALVTAQITSQMHHAAATIKNGATAELPDTLLTRLIVLHLKGGLPKWFNEDWIRRYLTGLVGTGGATIVRAFTQMLDQLLHRPQVLQEACDLVSRLDQEEQSGLDSRETRERLRLYMYEALRFRPMLPLLVRDSPRDTVIANDTPRVRLVPAGTRLLAPPLAAMFDPAVFPEPNRFNPKRCKDQYIHFGHGSRQCFGRYIADIALIEMSRALLRRHPSKMLGGTIQFDGPAPCSLPIDLNVGQDGV